MLRGRADDGDRCDRRIDLIEMKTPREAISVRYLPEKLPFDADPWL